MTIKIKNSYSIPDVIVELGFRVQLLPRYFKPYTIGESSRSTLVILDSEGNCCHAISNPTLLVINMSVDKFISTVMLTLLFLLPSTNASTAYVLQSTSILSPIALNLSIQISGTVDTVSGHIL